MSDQDDETQEFLPYPDNPIGVQDDGRTLLPDREVRPNETDDDDCDEDDEVS